MSPWHRGLDEDPDDPRIGAAEDRRDHPDPDEGLEHRYERTIYGEQR